MNTIVDKFNNTDTIMNYEKTYIESFEDNLKFYKNNTALVFKKKSLSYKELNDVGNKIAHILNKLVNKTNDRIGIYIDESIEMITSIIGVLKSSSSFIPMPDIFPINRVHDIIENANIKMLITKRELIKNEIISAKTLFIDEIDFTNENYENYENLKIESRAEDCIYSIYTSGSTGKPKGVSINNKNIINFSNYIKNRCDISKKDNFSKFAGFGFDASIIEIMPCLLNGCALHILEKELKSNINKLNEYFEDNKITISFLPTQFAELFMFETNNNSLRCLLTGGEKLKKVKLGNYRLLNFYGPTETTIAATCYEVLDEDIENIPIGKPLDNYKVYIVDPSMNLCPVGVEGELCAAGDGLGLGYIDLPEITAEKFVDNPFVSKEIITYKKYNKMYKTGDSAKWLPDGNIEYIGRMDFQVKIRGYRIELGEIEQKLIHYKDIKECTVIALKDNLDQDYICAYYVSKNKIDKNILKDFLSHSLPEYMIPSTFYWLEQFPINANGKIDRKNLPVPKLVKEEEYEEAINEKERLICKHLIEIFNLKKVSIMSNFFNLGGNSLKAMQLVSKIKNDYEISVSDILKAKTIRDISTKLSNKKESIRISKSTATQFPATKSQEGIYFASSIHPESIIYNTPTAISIEGMLNKNKLEESINLVLKNNRILRSYFTIENNEVIQNISECKPISLNYLKVNKEEVSSHFLNFVKPFILQEPLLLKFRLLEIEKNHHILFIDIHHLINDGYSQNLLVKEIFDLYNNFNVDNQKIDYLDYSLIEKEINKEKALKYWKDNLNQFEKTQIPFDFPETDFNNDGHQVILNIPEVLYNKLNSISKNLNITNYTVFLTAFAILEYKFSRKNTVTIGGFFSGRDNLETQNMLGMFVSTLPITLEINPSSSIKQLLIQVQEKVTEILENQDVSLSELVELSQLKIENGRNPFFTNSFNFVELFNYSSENINFKNINIHGLNKAHYDLSLNLFKIENKIEIVFEFSNTSYKRESIETVKDSYLEILNELTCSENSINKISFISPNNYDIILNKFNHTDFDFDNNLTFIELFEKTVEKHPNRIAISFNNHTLSYLELNTVGNQIARYLKDNSVKYNDIIAIYLDESLEMITGIIGILKTSASYIPIPDSFPIDRVNEILRDSYANILITNSKLTEKVLAIDSSIKIVYLDKHPFSKYEKSNLYIETKLNDCLYNIYTSGSTGKPKGVSINNRSTINFVNNIIQKYDITEKDQFSKFAGYGFDASIVEIMPSLISGSCLHIIDKSIKLDLQKLNQYFEKNKITVTFLPTQFAELFMQQVENKSLRYLITGGDRLKKVKLGNYKILNIYGPTETTVACTIYEVTNAHEKNIPIGSPLLNYKIYITDADMNLCPIGVEGELCIAGEGLAIEYINLPELTSQKFIQNPFINPNEKNYDKYSKMYRSADLAKWLPDGNVEFIGRIDFQVKIRGFRIELGEIEQSILNMEGITECLVLSLKDNSQEDYLCAYYVSENPINENVFHEFLSINLPEYMIPASFYWLKQFPINQNGKIDRKKLPIPEVKVEKNIILPENKNEEIVFNHVNDILKITHLSMESNFFQLGGNSLKAVELVSKLQNKFNISIGDIFKYKTIKNIASSLKEKTNFNHIKKCTLEKYPISSSQKGIYFASIIDETSTIYNIPLAIEINGNLNKDKLGLSLDKLIKNNRIFCTKFILENNSVFQYIDKNTEIKKDFQKSRIEEIPALFNEFIKPFNLAEPPLIRIKLIQIENKKHILFLDTHHIINDGFSHNILIQELFNLYFENPSIINELDYLDFAIFENKNLEMRENSTKYWKTKANQIEKTYIPFDFPEFQFSDSGEIITLNLPKEFSEKILEFSSKNNLTLYNILLSTFFILIYKISRKQNVTIGGFFSGRYLADMQNMLGMFVSTLPITYKVNSEETIESFLHSIQMQISEVLEYQNFSIAELSELSESQSENGRNKFFNNAFNFIETTDLNYKNLSLNLLDLKAKTKAHFDLTLNCYKMNDEIKIDFEYSTKSYKAESIRTYIDSYYKILTEITEKNNTIKNIEFIPNNNKEIILSKFNKTEVINNYSKSFIDIFQDFAKNNPYNEALVFKDQRYNYLELNTISNQLAKHLINLGVKSNDKIGIYIDESLEMITSIFAILKTTASFIPMPNTFPINRVKDILSDSESKILFTKKSFVNKDEIDIPNLKIIYFEDLNIKDFWW